MKALSAGLIVIFAGFSISVGHIKAADSINDVAVLENGTIYSISKGVLRQQAYSKGLTPFRGSLVTIDEPNKSGIIALTAWKNDLYYIETGELWRIPDGQVAKRVISLDQIKQLSQNELQLRSVKFDANGQQYLIATNTDAQAGILKRSNQGNLSVLIAPGVIPELRSPVSMAIAGESSLLVQCSQQPQCYIVCLAQKKIIGTIPRGNVTSLTYDHVGRLYAIDKDKSQIVIQRHPQAQVKFVQYEGLGTPAAIAYDSKRNCLQVVQVSNRDWDVVNIPVGDPASPVDESPLPFKVAPAFPNIEWAGWEPVNDKGIAVPLRPLLLTHANDQSGRNFVGTEHGVVHVFPNTPDVKKTKVFLDIQDRVSYKDSQNEEGFLGLSFHPKYKQNGEFFVNYTKKPGLLTVVSRFKVSKDDPDKADLASEEVLFTLKKPMWNHSGGTLSFGPDGYLYIVFGDGGGANDMFKNSRKMNTFHSKIIRIDVDSKSDDKPYGIPKDNPFVGKEGFSPEIFCYGVRNPWRMSFDRKTGQGWFADVGQNLYEEINLLQKGADYGWSARESFHPFGPNSLPVNDKMVEPIWEYNHLVGKSITGGFVYRGKQFPELDGWYLYADYVSAKIWALKYDFTQKRVVANREIANRGLPIMSFGEDENGELYLMTFSASGQGVDRIIKK